METAILREADLNKVVEEQVSSIFGKRLDTIEGSLGNMAKLSDIKAELDAFKPVAREVEVVEKEEETADLEARGVAGVFDQAMKFEVWGVPLGQAAVGGFAAIFSSELIDGFMVDQSANIRGLVKLGVAGAMVMFLSKWLGKPLTLSAGLLLTFDAIRDLTPIDSWAAQLADKITGQAPVAGLRGRTAEYGSKSAVVQAQNVADSYSSIIRREG